MAPSFTFVNVSNAPGLGPKEAKQMRGHITKTNFAKRRQRLGKPKNKGNTTSPSSPSSALTALGERQLRHALEPVADSLLVRMIEPTYSPVEYLVCEYRALIFPAGLGSPGSNREADWIALLHSEPALVEASMAIAIRHSPRLQRTHGIREASVRKGRAIKMINERLDTPLGLTDGVLSAVFTLTFAEARNTAIPSWFGDFILYDSIGHTILSASYSNVPLINALRNEDDPKQMDVAAIRSDANDLRQLIDNYHASTTLERDTAAIISYSLVQLLRNPRVKFVHGGQDVAMETLTAVFAPDARLLEKFKTVWDEVSFGQQAV
ncbi:hypothetical protein FOC4_g10005188 [Fusarium odoratissimum]|uniref:Uncharacterized protein n=2 Tax=Fusarium oxysporum species complex TaxID=171631 RepID=N1RXW7_FUSC4|nr:hypothetical protein FOC4_g10005188 [Fusarium odoratissimum]TXB96501.1 hypothetical protein FocTR4_00011471 [Fusarium oxysporum f. sp. cubense]